MHTKKLGLLMFVGSVWVYVIHCSAEQLCNQWINEGNQFTTMKNWAFWLSPGDAMLKILIVLYARRDEESIKEMNWPRVQFGSVADVGTSVCFWKPQSCWALLRTRNRWKEPNLRKDNLVFQLKPGSEYREAKTENEWNEKVERIFVPVIIF